jgi:hypothetical protein
MTISKSIKRLTISFLASSATAAALALCGCGSETIDASSAKSQKSTYEKDVNQATKGKQRIVTKSVKSLIAKDAAKE